MQRSKNQYRQSQVNASWGMESSKIVDSSSSSTARVNFNNNSNSHHALRTISKSCRSLLRRGMFLEKQEQHQQAQQSHPPQKPLQQEQQSQTQELPNNNVHHHDVVPDKQQHSLPTTASTSTLSGQQQQQPKKLIDHEKIQGLLGLLRSDKFAGVIDPNYHTRYVASLLHDDGEDDDDDNMIITTSSSGHNIRRVLSSSIKEITRTSQFKEARRISNDSVTLQQQVQEQKPKYFST